MSKEQIEDLIPQGRFAKAGRFLTTAELSDDGAVGDFLFCLFWHGVVHDEGLMPPRCGTNANLNSCNPISGRLEF